MSLSGENWELVVRCGLDEHVSIHSTCLENDRLDTLLNAARAEAHQAAEAQVAGLVEDSCALVHHLAQASRRLGILGAHHNSDPGRQWANEIAAFLDGYHDKARAALASLQGGE